MPRSGCSSVAHRRLPTPQAGVTDGALRMTAAYTSTREQFEKPLSTFQSVALKAADAYLDTTAIQSAARQAAWTARRRRATRRSPC